MNSCNWIQRSYFSWKEIAFNIVANGQRHIFFLNKSYYPKMSFTDSLTRWITLYDSFIPWYLRIVEHSSLESWMLSSLCHLAMKMEERQMNKAEDTRLIHDISFSSLCNCAILFNKVSPGNNVLKE
jgi:hypothetical protein